MKYILMISAALLISACSSAHKCGECDKAAAGTHQHEGKAACCAEKGNACCEGKGEECCKDKTKACCAQAPAAATTGEGGNVTVAASPEAIGKIYVSQKSKLGPACAQPAREYCGKVTRDMNISEVEFQCLWTKSFRATREVLDKLDGTKCDAMIKSFAKK